MSDKHSRAGGKFSGNHVTLVPAASILCDIATACFWVTKISPGFIKSGLPPVNGRRRVKISKHGGEILLAIRDNTSHQEVHVYVSNVQEAMLAIARGARDHNICVSFGLSSF